MTSCCHGYVKNDDCVLRLVFDIREETKLILSQAASKLVKTALGTAITVKLLKSKVTFDLY